MIGRAVRRGVRSATRRPKLVALLWAWNLVLAALVALPLWTWIYRASSVSPVTDALLDGADLGMIVALMVNEGPAAFTLLAAAAALAVASLLSGAFLSGGILEVVTTEGDGGPLAPRFFGGAGRFFGRFLRLLAIAAATGLPVLVLVSLALNAATSPLSNSGSEPAALWATLIIQVGSGLVFAWLLLALDYARVFTAMTGSRSMFRSWLRGLTFVVRRLAGVALIGVFAAIGVLASLAVTYWYDASTSGRTWIAIVGTFAVHQAMLLLRTGVRVAHVSTQAEYWKALQPPIPAASAVAAEIKAAPSEPASALVAEPEPVREPAPDTVRDAAREPAAEPEPAADRERG